LVAMEAATAFVSTSVTIRIFACALFAQLFSDISKCSAYVAVPFAF
jgi:hypothetical protein